MSSITILDSTLIVTFMTTKDAWEFLEKKYDGCISQSSVSSLENIAAIASECYTLMAFHFMNSPSISFY